MAEEGGQGSFLLHNLAVNAISDNTSFSHEGFVVFLLESSEAELLGHNNALAAGELHLGTSEAFNCELLVLGVESHGEQAGSDLDASALSERLTEGPSHTCLQTIGACAGQHLIDSEHVPGVHSDSQVERLFAALLDHVSVGSNTGSLESFRGNLFLFERVEMHGGWEGVVVCSLLSRVVHTDLGVRHTTVKPRFRVWLVLAVAIAPSWSSAHIFYYNKSPTTLLS